MHPDGSWPGSGLRDGKLVRDLYGDRRSALTFLLYLDSDFEGGETSFSDADGNLVSVAVPKGSVLWCVEPWTPWLAACAPCLSFCKPFTAWRAHSFFHGDHEDALLHEGSLVTKGVKRVVRSDVLYGLPGAPPLTLEDEECVADNDAAADRQFQHDRESGTGGSVEHDDS